MGFHIISTVAGESLEWWRNRLVKWHGSNYTPKDRAIMKDLLRRAKDHGYQNIVVTADVPAQPARTYADCRRTAW